MGMNEKEFYKRSVLDKIADYKYSVLGIIISFVAAALIYLMFAEKYYTTDATVEVSPKFNKLSNVSSLENTQSVFARHLQTQIDFLQSRSLIEQVIEKINANVHFFENNGVKYQRIVRNIPYRLYIHIKDPSFFEKYFLLEPVDKDHFRLSLVYKKNLFFSAKTSSFIYRFDKPIRTKYFDLIVSRKPHTPAKRLYFKVYDQKAYVGRVLQNLTVRQNNDKSSMIKIIYSDTNPHTARKFVNTLIQTFLQINRKQEIEETDNLLKLITEKLKEAKHKLDASEKQLKAYIAGNKVAGLGEQTNQIINAIFKSQKNLEELKIRMHKLKMVKLLYQKGYDYRKIIALVQEINNPNLTKFINTISADEDAYRKLRMRFKPKHPAVIKMRYIIHEKLKALMENINELMQDTRSQIALMERTLKKYQSQLTTLPQKEFGYTRLKRKHDLLEKNYLFLLDKQMQVFISKQTQGSFSYRVIDYAYTPEFASKPKTKVLLLLSIVLGTMVAFLYALLRDYFSRYIKAPREVEELTTLPYLGTIPYIEDKRLYNDLFVLKSPDSYASEMIWSLRTVIEDNLRDRKQLGGMIIAVTSVVKGEGKTTVSANLALSLGMGDKKSVVVSMDLRLPELHIKFGIPNDKGITSVLFQDAKLEDVTYHPKQLPNFAVIPAGNANTYPLKIINSRKIDAVLSRLRAEYDYVVLDLPPMGVAAESVFLMSKSDLVINILKAHYSEKSFLMYLESIIAKHKLKNVYLVLNGVRKKYIKILTRKENLKYIKSHQKRARKNL